VIAPVPALQPPRACAGARGCTLAPCTRGFTLVEIMVVVVIIALLAAGAILSMSLVSGDNEPEQEGKRLTELMNYAHEQATLQTREFGLYLTDHDYRFVVFDPLRGVWVNVDDDDALRRRDLPSDLTLSLQVEARDVVLPTAQDEQKQAAASQQAAAAQQSAASEAGSAPLPGPAALQGLGSAAQSLQPQVMIFSNGDLTSFQLTLQEGSHTVTLQSDDQGDVQLHEPQGHSA